MLNGIANLINRTMGRYTLDGHYVGKAKFNIILNRAKKLYEGTKDDSLEDIMKAWQEMLDSAISDSNIEKMMRIGGLPNHAQSFSDDSTIKFIMSRCYKHVVAKRYEEAYGRKLGGR
mgnify:CR=1 FL=1